MLKILCRSAALSLVLLCVSVFAVAESRSVSVTVKADSERQAQSKALEKASLDVALEKAKGLMGAQRYKENLRQLRKQLRKDLRRFVPFSKIKKKTAVAGGYEVQVDLQISEDGLKKVLQRRGLLAVERRSGIVFPFVEINDHVNGETYRWWQSEAATKLGLTQSLQDFEKEMAQGFTDRGLLLLKPETFGLRSIVPKVLKKSILTQTEKAKIAKLKNSQLYIEGKIDIIDSPIVDKAFRVRFALSCHQAGNGKTVAEVVRLTELKPGKSVVELQQAIASMSRESGAELGGQIFSLLQRGSLDAEVLRLAVTGRLSHRQMMRLKESIASGVSGIKNLRESLFEPGRVTFQLEYSGGGAESLKVELAKVKLEGFLSQVVSSSQNEVTLDVKPTQ